MDPFRDNVEALKIKEKIDKTYHEAVRMNNRLDTVFDILNKEESATTGLLKSWKRKYTYWLNTDGFGLIWNVGYRTVVVLAFMALCGAGIKAGCSYSAAVDLQVNEEICTRMCEGIGGEYVSRNSRVVDTNGNLDERLTYACVCARDNQVFAVDSVSGQELRSRRP